MTLLLPSTGEHHAMPSSLIQLVSVAKESVKNIDPDSVLGMITSQVEEFQKKMAGEIASDKEEVRKLQEQQRKMDREEKAFKARIFAHRVPTSSLVETSGTTTHFGDPYIDEAMRTIGDDLESQKRELEGIVATHHHSSSLAQEKESRGDLGVIQSALRTRLAMVGK